MTLLVFAGLPGTGKTTVARAVADRLGATFLRIDSIESAIAAILAPFSDNPVGYVVAERVADDQLRAGRDVVVDAVNDVELARTGWPELGVRHDVPARFVEIVCSDLDKHRRRVESRTADLPGHEVPDWQQVADRVWEPFAEPRLRVDNLGPVADAVERVVAWLDRVAPR